MEGFIGEHGNIIISGILAVTALVAVVMIAKTVGNIDYFATLSVIGG